MLADAVIHMTSVFAITKYTSAITKYILTMLFSKNMNITYKSVGRLIFENTWWWRALWSIRWCLQTQVYSLYFMPCSQRMIKSPALLWSVIFGKSLVQTKKHMSASESNLLCASNMNTILLQYGYEGLALAVTVLLDEQI